MKFVTAALIILMAGFALAQVVSKEIRLKHIAAADVAKMLVEETEFAVKLVKSPNAVVVTGEGKAVEEVAKKIAAMDVPPEQVLIQLKFFRGEQLFGSPIIRTVMGKEASITLSSGQTSFGFKVTPRRVGGSLVLRPTISLGEVEFTLPGNLPAWSSVTFSAGEGGWTAMRLLTKDPLRVSQINLGTAWSELTEFGLEMSVQTSAPGG